MEIVKGALPSVLSKLGGLLINEYNLQKGLKGEIMVLETELERMQAALEKLSSIPPEQVDKQDKIWAKHVRELSYDIEDSIDAFMVHDKGSNDLGFKNFIDRSFQSWSQFCIRRNIANEIRGIKRRVREVSEQSVRYKIDADVARPVMIDTHVFARYKKVTDLVGIDEQRDALINILMEGDQVSKQQYNIVSIVGFGGLGKTTLANVVYEKLRGQFDCSAFVSVSQNPDEEKLFMEMSRQLATYGATIDAIRDFLLTKRYIIIIDDIWDITVWKLIRCALPDNNFGYRIITTTRISDIAKQVGGTYKMKPLSLHKSRKLLYGRIFGSENKQNIEDAIMCPDEMLAEVSDKILKKCAGVPLAIITTSSLLASKGRNEIDWYEVCNSIGTGLEDGHDVDNMRKILSLSYYSMPSHLRTCLLYLTVFPEDYKIEKDRLIRMWIGEGFVKCKKQGDSLLELGDSYFNELINRSVIEPLCEEYNGLVDHCRVHDMMLDLICSISIEENFVTTLNDVHHISASQRVRRLSIQSNKVDHATLGADMSMRQVRSVVVFAYKVNVLPALPSFRVLRVLELDCNEISPDCCLKSLGYLLLLRYLRLTHYGIKEIPEEIPGEIPEEIVNLRFLQVMWVASTVFQFLTDLKSLKLRGEVTYVLTGIGSLTSLEELEVEVTNDNSSENIMEDLGCLTELRVLSIVFRIEGNKRWEKSVVECLCKLTKLRSLHVRWFAFELNLDGWATPRHLHRFDTRLSWWISKLPAWMEHSSLLVDLSFISIFLTKLRREDLEILGRLPALRILHLKTRYHRGGFIFGAGSFPSLVHCRLDWNITEPVAFPVVFQEGAMRRLKRLEFEIHVLETRNGKRLWWLGVWLGQSAVAPRTVLESFW
ncbi:hypothetical protein HU200_048689 [Digitaria exilis]|uniref:Uncharacterized protein n=1 Tax=Digitaria exilis TaxID=1010633 RepID=A0A835AZU2_9POAL|nr:hypothetical protein HU200_048689 [Digitaria exilis]